MANALPSLARLSLRAHRPAQGKFVNHVTLAKLWNSRKQSVERGRREVSKLNEDNEPWCIICHDTFETGREAATQSSS